METMNYGVLSKDFSYRYADNGQKGRFMMPDGATYTYEYGENNELRQVSLPGVGAITYPSYTWNRPDSVSYPGGGTRTFTYDPLMRLRRLLARDPGGNALLDVQYQYDRLNNILTKTTPQGTVNYTYDAISRLTGVQVEHPTAGQTDEGFTYDRVGNRTTEEGIEGEWGYNANNELLTFANTAYTYDANGNTTQITLDGTVMFTYHYNTFDRLVQVDDVNENTIAEYYYDPFGRRLWKQAGGQTTLFFYSDEGLVAEYDASGAEMRSYGYRPDATWTTDPLWLKQEGEYYFYHNDHLGTPRKLVQQNGAVVWSASYTAFGQATVEVETVTNNLRFPGQYFDAETGLHYNLNRYYKPNIGRYLRRDPLDIILEKHHPYKYARNNPMIFIDPLGLKCIDALVSSGTNPTFFYCGRWRVLSDHIGERIPVVGPLFFPGVNETPNGQHPPCLLCWKVECPQGYSLEDGSVKAVDITEGPFPWATIRLQTYGESVKDWSNRPPHLYVPNQTMDYCLAIKSTTALFESHSLIKKFIRLTFNCCPNKCSKQ